MTINRFVKYARALSTPAFWPALAKGVMPTVEHIKAIERLAPKTLIDVGANKGQFSVMARYLFPDIDIHAFEPLDSERRFINAVVPPPVTLYSNALGARAGEAEFFVASRADSSSLFKPGAGQEEAYDVVYKSSINVLVERLADKIDVRQLRPPILMKLDIQGGELDALKGAHDLLPAIDYIYCETSFVPLYDNQPLATDLVSYLINCGFLLSGVYNQSQTQEFGATQADFLWTRP
jgi:FkbM family methyltransferase